MKNLRNQVQLVGHLGTEPELKEFESGAQKVSFTMATNESYKNKEGEFVNETQWHKISSWNGTAKYAQKYLSKGMEIMLQGKITYNSYEDKNGIKRYVTEIVADQIMMISKKEKEA